VLLTMMLAHVLLAHVPPTSGRVALVVAPSHVRAPLAAVVMHAKRGRKPKEVVEAPLEEEEEEEQGRSVQLVDAMATSLGREDELKPYPGPTIVDEPLGDGDTRSLFVHFARFSPSRMPSAALQEAYVSWLEDTAAQPDVSLCLPQYMLAAQRVDDFWETGAVLTDEDIARLDAQEEAEASAAAAAAATAAEEATEVGGDAAVADYVPPARMEMEPTEVAFVLGHLTVCRAKSSSAATAWATSDPVLVGGGYSETRLHEWARSSDEALCVRTTGESLQPYCVHCLDRADATELRAATRGAHLEWLRESGRVVMVGPLLEPRADEDADAASGGAPVGSLLVVNGDDLDEVRDWAAADPYQHAGLFASVTVAPLCMYAVACSEENAF